MKCSPYPCPDGYACVDMGGEMQCRPKCWPACGRGFACDYTASPPACILPDPEKFTLFIAMSQRFQDPLVAEDLSTEDMGGSSSRTRGAGGWRFGAGIAMPPTRRQAGSGVCAQVHARAYCGCVHAHPHPHTHTHTHTKQRPQTPRSPS